MKDSPMPDKPDDNVTDATPIEEKIARMLLVGFRGLTIDDDDPVADDLLQNRIGGVIVFDYDSELNSPRRNIASPGQLRELIADIRRRSRHPLLVAVDQEGGKVARLKPRHGYPPLESHRFLGRADNPDLTRQQAQITAEILAEAGFNLNFAPVLDLDRNPDSPAIGRYERSFSADPETVIRHGRIFLEAMRQHGIIAAAKHFPGHGSACGDTHLGMVDTTDSWDECELIPYRCLIAENLISMIMCAHVFNRRLDPDYPATLSRRTISGLLRKELGFTGVIVSDDLDMKAIATHFSLERAVKLAIDAGIDLLMFGNNLAYTPDIAKRVVDIVVDLVQSGAVSAERIDESYRRILKLTACG